MGLLIDRECCNGCGGLYRCAEVCPGSLLSGGKDGKVAHREPRDCFLKNMISGASSADAALLLIDGHEGVREQSRRHGYILKLLGIPQIHVVINKMDLVSYSEAVYQRIVQEYSDFLTSIDVIPRNFIPVSAKNGENILNRSGHLQWYQGPTIIEAIDGFEKGSDRTPKNLRFPVQDIYKFDERRIIAGRIESGTLRQGDTIYCWPQGTSTKIKSIEKWQAPVRTLTGSAGESVGITLQDPLFLERGTLISGAAEFPSVGRTFTANIFWLGKEPLHKGKNYKLKIATQETDCEVFAIHNVYDSSDLSVYSTGDAVPTNYVAEVTVKTKLPVAFDQFSSIQETGRFVLVDGHGVCGGGIITGNEEALQIGDLEETALRAGVVQFGGSVTQAEREARNGHPGWVVWINGLPGGIEAATLANRLERDWFDQGKQVYWLNGESFENLRHVAEAACFLMLAGNIVIVSDTGANGPGGEEMEQIKGIIGPKRFMTVLLEHAHELSQTVAKAKQAFQEQTKTMGNMKAS